MAVSPRIVSLLPSATEIVCALGFREKLVGRSHECDYPEEVEDLPVCSSPRVEMDGGSREIDDSIRDIVRRGLSVYEVQTDVLRSLKPDYIVTQTQCEVCAVSEKQLRRAVQEWTGAKPEIISLSPCVVEDVLRDIRRVAEILGVRHHGDKIVDVLRSRMRSIKERTAVLGNRPRVATIEWIDPLMSGGNWMPELVEMASAENLFGQTGKHSPKLQWQELRAADPDAILISPCGFDLNRTLQAAKTLETLEGWDSLTAVKNSRCFAADGHHFFNRPGPRLADSLEIITQALYPDHFDFGHGPERWRQIAGIEG